MAEVEECRPEDVSLDPARLRSVVKFRCSIRDYRPRAVTEETLRLALQAGRYTATARNVKACPFIVVQRELKSSRSGSGTASAAPTGHPPG